MPKQERWSVDRELIVELYREKDGRVVDAHTGEALPGGLQPFVHHPDGFSAYELVINFSSVGYHLDASMYGGPDQLGWPSEHEDERSKNYVMLLSHLNNPRRSVRTLIKRELSDILFEHFRDAVEEHTLEE